MMRAPTSGHLSCYVTYVLSLSANLDRKPILETLRQLVRVGVGHDLAPGQMEDDAGKRQISRLVGRSQRRLR